MALDLAVSRAITMVHILERALHDPGPWSLRINGSFAPAERRVERDRVVFSAEFPALERADGAIMALALYCGPHLVALRKVQLGPDANMEPFVTEWTLTLPQAVAA
jgi:hypothetical protein